MASRLYKVFNSTQGTTAAPVKVATGTSIKTLLQIATPSTLSLEVVEWGISFDAFAAAQPGVVELLTTGAINATVTAFVATDVVKLTQAAALASNITLGTTTSGFTASAEGSITAAVSYDTQLLPPTAPYIIQYPLERGPEVGPSTYLRVRITVPTTSVNALTYVCWAE